MTSPALPCCGAAPRELRRGRSPYANAPRLPEGDALDPLGVLSVATAERRPSPQSVELEIGPGRGGFLIERALARPDVVIIGLEIRLKWASLVDQKARDLGMGDRARVFAADVRAELPRFRAGCFRRVFFNFPDPWWKKRHAKRRLASDAVLDEVRRLLAPGGELFLQTDVVDTARGYERVIEGHPEWSPFGDEPGSALLADHDYEARSPRERRVMGDGLPIVRLRYRRLPEA